MLWTPLAEIAEKFLKKGGQVYIEGKLTTRSWDDQDGNKRYTTEVVGRELTLLGSRPEGGNSSDGGNNMSESPVSSIPEDDTDDLPF